MYNMYSKDAAIHYLYMKFTAHGLCDLLGLQYIIYV